MDSHINSVTQCEGGPEGLGCSNVNRPQMVCQDGTTIQLIIMLVQPIDPNEIKALTSKPMVSFMVIGSYFFFEFRPDVYRAISNSGMHQFL